MKMHAYASSQYIRRYGAPQTLDDLDDHAIISYSGTPAAHLRAIRWLETAGLDGKAPRKPAFAANSVIAMKYAIRAGIGIGLIPDYLTDEETDLVPVLQDVELPTVLGLLRLSGGAEDRQEGAGLPRFPGRQGAAVEVLSVGRRPSHAASAWQACALPYFQPPADLARCTQL